MVEAPTNAIGRQSKDEGLPGCPCTDYFLWRSTDGHALSAKATTISSSLSERPMI